MEPGDVETWHLQCLKLSVDEYVRFRGKDTRRNENGVNLKIFQRHVALDSYAIRVISSCRHIMLSFLFFVFFFNLSTLFIQTCLGLRRQISYGTGPVTYPVPRRSTSSPIFSFIYFPSSLASSNLSRLQCFAPNLLVKPIHPQDIRIHLLLLLPPPILFLPLPLPPFLPPQLLYASASAFLGVESSPARKPSSFPSNPLNQCLMSPEVITLGKSKGPF